MSELLVILALMILCHLLADYPLQGWLAQAKAKAYWKDTKTPNDWIMALLCHATMWGIMIYLPIIIFGEIDFEWYVCLMFWLTLPLNICGHFLIDNAKANEHKINLIVDQMCHLIQILMTWTFYILLLWLF